MKRIIGLILACLFLGIGFGEACQVPVFRFALERWVADSYQVVLASSASPGKLSPSEAKVAEFLEGALNKNGSSRPNYTFSVVKSNAGERSGLIVFYPPDAAGRPGKRIWQGEATLENAKKIVDSPVRRELRNRIISGDSAVWVFFKGSDEAQNSALRTTLEESFSQAEKDITIPEGVVTDAEAMRSGFTGDVEDVVQSGVPLKIDFSLIEISRDDPAEEVLVAMLMNVESDLWELTGTPLVFPVFGRCRVIEPLASGGINSNMIFNYCLRLCGACSCEIKSQNPGMDLLVMADWESAIQSPPGSRSEQFDELRKPQVVVFEGKETESEPASLRDWRKVSAAAGVLLVLATIVYLRRR